MALPTPLESESRERLHVLFAWAICLEAAFCFAAPVVGVIIGVMYLPLALFELAAAIGSANGPDFDMVLFGGGSWICGGIGVCAAARVLLLLCGREERDERARLTLLGLSCGIACALSILSIALRPGEDDSGPLAGPASFGPIFLTYLPLACTAHLIYLARRPLFGQPQRASLAEEAR